MKRTPGDVEKAVAYRNRAEECRTMASDFQDEGRRRVLESLADDYDRLAELKERELKLYRALGS